MFRFFRPCLDGSVVDTAIGARDLAAAFDQFRRYHWLCTTPGAIAVFHNHTLVGRVLPELDEASGENVPMLQEGR